MDTASGEHGRGTRTWKWLGLAAWLLIAALLIPLANRIGDVENNDATTWLPRSAETTKAIQRAEGAFPGSDTLVAVVAYEDMGGITAADRAKVDADGAVYAPLAQGGRVAPAVPSADGRALLVSFPLAGDDDAQSAAVTTIRDTIATGRPAGLDVALTGSAGAVADITDAFSGLDTTLIFVTAGVVALLLLLRN